MILIDLADEVDDTPHEPAIRQEVLDELAQSGWFGAAAPRFDGAVCANHPDPDLWWRPADVKLASEVCAKCPALDECRDYGWSVAQDGVWGGEAVTPPPPDRACRHGHRDWRWSTEGRWVCAACKRAVAKSARKRKRNKRDEEQLAQAA